MEELARNREKDHLLIQQSRLASMGEMVHNIAYQWRQPLNAASVIVQNIKTVMDWEELTNDYVNHAVSKSMKIMEHMSNTIDDFRNFFKPEKARSVFSLKDEINKTIAIISERNKEINNLEKKGPFTVEFQGDPRGATVKIYYEGDFIEL